MGESNEQVKVIGSTEDCRGCLSKMHISTLSTGTIERDECSHTDPSVLDIPECPCKVCIVKVMCNTLCQEFIDTAKRYPGAQRLTLRIGQIKKGANEE